MIANGNKTHQIVCPRCARRFGMCACEVGKRHKTDWACFGCTEVQSILLRLSPEQATVDKFIENGLKRFEDQLGERK